MSQPNLQLVIERLLETKEVDYFIAYEQGSRWFKVRPVILRGIEEKSQLVWNRFCYPNLTAYLKNSPRILGKIGILVKGCDIKNLVELIKNNQIERDKIYIVQVPCTGVIDPKKVEELFWTSDEIIDFGENEESITITTDNKTLKLDKKEVFFSKCYNCDFLPSPLADVYLEELKLNLVQRKNDTFDPYSRVQKIEAMCSSDREIYWEKQFSRCIRCFACRNICPACFCPTCIFDQKDVRWINKGIKTGETKTFHLTRALHVATLCTGCGECERVCPMRIPLMDLNLKLIKEIDDLFDYQAGINLESVSPLKEYDKDDYDEFK